MVSPDSTLTMDYPSTPKLKKSSLSSTLKSPTKSPTKSPGSKKGKTDKEKSSSSSSSSKSKKTKDLVSPRKSKKSSIMKNNLDFVSPTGVADFLQVEQMEALNNSFSWVDSADVGPIVSVSQPGKALSVSEEMAQVQERLQWLRQQRKQDKVDLQDNLDKAKRDLKKELKKIYDPLIKSNARADKEKSVKDMNKLVEYLRNDNAKIREEIVFYKKEMKRLLISNNQLEEANKKAMESLQELQEHVKDLEAAQAKLSDNCNVFKAALKKMKDDYKKRDAFYIGECRTLDRYEQCVVKVLAAVQKSSKTKQQQPKLVEWIETTAKEGSMEASSERYEHLAQLGLKPENRKNHLFDDNNTNKILENEDSDCETDSDCE